MPASASFLNPFWTPFGSNQCGPCLSGPTLIKMKREPALLRKSIESWGGVALRVGVVEVETWPHFHRVIKNFASLPHLYLFIYFSLCSFHPLSGVLQAILLNWLTPRCKDKLQPAFFSINYLAIWFGFICTHIIEIWSDCLRVKKKTMS